MSRTTNRTKCALILGCLASIVFVSLSVGQSANALSAPTSRPTIAYKSGTVVPSAEQDFLNRTNALRASLGLGALHQNDELLAKARAWSETQAEAGTIFHSTLTDGVTQNWYRLGENVGMGPDVASIHDALVRSPRHYENLTDPGFTEAGIGVVQQGDVMYVTEEFMQYMPSNASPSTPTPTAPPATQPRHRATGNVASIPAVPVAETAPLKTASPDLSAVIEKLSALEA